ncbi:hypothetical protein [Sinorhizobium sp. BJ1]|nr:hypothetical protein [Sinorhizobium sp. BJ1]
MTPSSLILLAPIAVLAGQALGFGFVYLVIQLDAASRIRRPSRVAPPAA